MEEVDSLGETELKEKLKFTKDYLNDLKRQYDLLSKSEAEARDSFNKRGFQLEELNRQLIKKDQDLKAHQEAIHLHMNTIAGNAKKITNLEKAIATHEKKIASQKETIHNQEKKIASQKKAIAAHTETINELLEGQSSEESQKGGKKLNKKQLLEEKRKWEEEKAAKDQQLRAYKRQVDDLRQQLESERERHQQTRKDQEHEVHKLTSELDTEKKSNVTYVEALRRCGDDLAIAKSNLEKYKQDTDRMKQANVVLRTRLQETHPQVAHSDSRGYPGGESRSEQVLATPLPPVPSQYYPHTADDLIGVRQNDKLEEYTRRADLALKDLDEVRIQSGQVMHGNVHSHLDQTMQGVSAGRNEQTYPVSNTRAEPRRIEDEEEDDIPYDPNLVCPGCNARYRVGEIQKLRRHIREFCTAAALN